ncbi:MAG: hypothetical protein HN548_13260 [Opitutae bacterium]|nr:hypothetical protein [Opitutae bacterium]
MYFLNTFYFLPPPKNIFEFNKVAEKVLVIVNDDNSHPNIQENNFFVERLENIKMFSVYSTSDLESLRNIGYDHLVISFSKDPCINHALLDSIPDDASLQIASDTLPSPFRLSNGQPYHINQAKYLLPTSLSIRQIFTTNRMTQNSWALKSEHSSAEDHKHNFSLEKFAQSLDGKDNYSPSILKECGLGILRSDTVQEAFEITNIEKNYYYEDLPFWLRKRISVIMIECWINSIADLDDYHTTPFDQFIINAWIFIHATDLMDSAYKGFTRVINKNIDIQGHAIDFFASLYLSNSKFESLMSSICRKFLKFKYREIFVNLKDVNDSSWFKKNILLLKKEISCRKASRETISNLLIHYTVADDFDSANLICQEPRNKQDLNFLSLHYSATCILRNNHEQASNALEYYDLSNRSYPLFTLFFIFINIILGNNSTAIGEIDYLVKRGKIINIPRRIGNYQVLTIIQLSSLKQLRKITKFAKAIILESDMLLESDIDEIEKRNKKISESEDLINSTSKLPDLLNLTD